MPQIHEFKDLIYDKHTKNIEMKLYFSIQYIHNSVYCFEIARIGFSKHNTFYYKICFFLFVIKGSNCIIKIETTWINSC